MVSGFFLYSENDDEIRKRCTRRIKRLLILTVAVNGYAICKNVAIVTWKGMDLSETISGLASVNFWVFNFEFASYMWFVRALLYIYLFVRFEFVIWNRKRIERCMLPVCVILIVLNLILCKYSTVLGIAVLVDIYQIPSKLLGTAFPDFFIGYYIGRAYACGIIQKEKQKYYFTILFVGVIGMCMEYGILEFLKKNMPVCDYFSTYVMVTGIFLLLLINQNLDFLGISVMGRKYSMWIYVLHMNMRNLISRLHLEIIVTNEIVIFLCNSIVAYILSILIAYVILAVWNRIKRFLKSLRKVENI